MARFIINGKRPLQGVYKPSGNKNAALPMLAACLLTHEPVCLRNVPDIVDVQVMLDLLAEIGVEISRDKNTLRLCANAVRADRLSRENCGRVRSSILLAGPLAARHGRAELYPPGGDVIGRRRLDTHFLGLQALGMQLEQQPSTFRLTRPARLRGADILLDEASVTATENILMAACLARGRTSIFNAACEPHITDLARLLIRMGADIQGLGTNRLTIRGKCALGGASHRVGCDHIEVGSILAASAATGGDVRLPVGNDVSWLPVLRLGFSRLGIDLVQTPEGLAARVAPGHPQNPIHHGDIPKIEDGPWPTFPSDLMSVAIVLATQLQGTTLFFEKMFESRMYFVDNLIGMGARIVQCDPHRVVVVGPASLHAAHMNSPDIRAGMALLIAALCSTGQSVIENAGIVDRGYERIDSRLRQIGADITRQA